MHPLDVEAPAAPSMTIFTSYEDDYLRCARGINAHINSLWALRSGTSTSNNGSKPVPSSAANGGTAGLGPSPESVVDAATRLFEESESLVRGMEIEVRSMKGPERKRCAGKAQQYRNDLLSLSRAFDQARSRAAREPGYGSTAADAASATRVARLAAADESLARTSTSLADSRRVLADTETVGAGVVTDLEAQRQSLLRARDSVRETAYDTSEAREVLRAIARRDARHRAFLYCVIVALLCGIAFVLYLKLR